MTDPTLAAGEKSLATLRALFLADVIEPNALKKAVCAYVDDMKATGAPVERVIIDIKRVTEVEHGMLARALASNDSDEQRRARRMVEEAVRWCIEYYFWTG